MLDQNDDGFPDDIEVVYINELHEALRRYQARMLGLLPTPAPTPSQRAYALRVRGLVAAEDRHLHRLGLTRVPVREVA